jgi:hypothetical protein
MIEGIAMLTVLTGMGIYFVKSTDIPKDLIERSQRSQSETKENTFSTQKKYSFPTAKTASNETNIQKVEVVDLQTREKEIAAKEYQRKIAKQKIIQMKTLKIDELTLLITSLEQELRENNERNVEIQNEIDKAINELTKLQQEIMA